MASPSSKEPYHDKLPNHVAIIMDGNGRWAKKRFLGRIQGHEKGAEAVRTIIRTCREIGIPILTLYAFSTENWGRPKIEIDALMVLLKKFLISELKQMYDNDICLKAIGQIERLPAGVAEALNHAVELTKNNKGMLLNLALSYGGRSEIIHVVKEIVKKAKKGSIDVDSMSDTNISKLICEHLYSGDIPDPDLLIRTSGERRISNFLLWQIAYSEIFITDTLWPDFSREEFLHVIKDYQCRERRFGKIEAI